VKPADAFITSLFTCPDSLPPSTHPTSPPAHFLTGTPTLASRCLHHVPVRLSRVPSTISPPRALAGCHLHHVPVRLSQVPSTITSPPDSLCCIHACPSRLPPSSPPYSLVPSPFHHQPTSSSANPTLSGYLVPFPLRCTHLLCAYFFHHYFMNYFLTLLVPRF